MGGDGSSKMPFIMPNGQRLATFIDTTEVDKPRRAGKKGKKSGAAAAERKWQASSTTSHIPAAVLRSTATHATGAAASSELEQVELQALQKVGARRRLRWLNDRLLREMAGPLTASDMESLFKPVPFGVVHESVFSVAAQPENAAVWSHFVSINPDKEARVLEKWEAHIAELSRAAHQAPPGDAPALDAIARWSRIPRRARAALKSASPLLVAELEGELLPLLDDDPATAASAAAAAALAAGGTDTDEEAAAVVAGEREAASDDSTGEQQAAAVRRSSSRNSLRSSRSRGSTGSLPQQAQHRRQRGEEEELVLELELDDAFQRLLVHGLASYHGLRSASRDAPSASAPEAGAARRVLVVRRPPPPVAAAASQQQQQQQQHLPPAADGSAGDAAGAAVVGAPAGRSGAAPAPAARPPLARPEVLCADLLFLLEEAAAGGAGGGLTGAALRQLLHDRGGGTTSCDER